MIKDTIFIEDVSCIKFRLMPHDDPFIAERIRFAIDSIPQHKCRTQRPFKYEYIPSMYYPVLQAIIRAFVPRMKFRPIHRKYLFPRAWMFENKKYGKQLRLVFPTAADVESFKSSYASLGPHNPFIITPYSRNRACAVITAFRSYTIIKFISYSMDHYGAVYLDIDEDDIEEIIIQDAIHPEMSQVHHSIVDAICHIAERSYFPSPGKSFGNYDQWNTKYEILKKAALRNIKPSLDKKISKKYCKTSKTYRLVMKIQEETRVEMFEILTIAHYFFLQCLHSMKNDHSHPNTFFEIV